MDRTRSGSTSYDNGHSHSYTVDSNGNGRTNAGPRNGHVHTVTNWVVQNARGHSHVISQRTNTAAGSSTRPVDTSYRKSTNAKYKRKKNSKRASRQCPNVNCPPTQTLNTMNCTCGSNNGGYRKARVTNSNPNRKYNRRVNRRRNTKNLKNNNRAKRTTYEVKDTTCKSGFRIFDNTKNKMVCK
tara:strand:- start:54 stop:605 length:552 start_codon:yes stop_codon:yes gene_type:complete